MIRIVNKVLESVRPIDVSPEPLNEVFFNKHPLLRTVEKIFAQWQTIARTQGYNAFKKTVESNTSLKRILMDLFGFSKVELLTSTDNTAFTNAEMRPYTLTPAGEKMNKEIQDYVEQLKRQDPNPRGIGAMRKPSAETELKINSYIDSIKKELDSRYNQIVGFGHEDPSASEVPQYIPITSFYNHKYLIIEKNGIKFNNKLVKMTLSVGLGYPYFTDKRINPKIITATLLHEIGHNFTLFLLPPRLEVNRGGFYIRSQQISKGDEFFADQFVAMYGYGYDHIKQFLEWMKSKDESFFDLKDSYDSSLRIKTDEIIEDEHPSEKSRINNMINQMRSDLKDPSLSDQKRKSLQAILKQSKKQMQRFKKDNFILDRFEKEVSEKEYEAFKKDEDEFFNPYNQANPYTIKVASPKRIKIEMLRRQ